MRLVLASASPARLALLRAAGFDPEVVVSGVGEDVAGVTDTRSMVEALARRKAAAVASGLSATGATLVLGCDSLLEFDGSPYGKPASGEEALARWRAMRGRSGILHTGHHLVDGEREAAEVTSTTVWFGEPTDAELAAYVETGEPMAVAGGFTLDGRASPWIERIDGDPSTVIGLSLPAFGRLLRRLDRSIVELWSPAS